MRIDHLVWYTADLADGERQFTRWMDAAPAYGGVHPGEGTRNALVSLADDAYIEILARDPAQSETAVDPEVRGLDRAGLYHFAMSGEDLRVLKSRGEGAGLSGSGIVTGGRTLPDGRWLGWSLFGLRDHGFGALVPFFIDWTGSEHPAKGAPRGGRLISAEARTPDVRGLRAVYAALGIAIPVVHAARPSLAVTIENSKGRCVLETVEPLRRGYVI
ncbi:MAG: VOC family protein [Hyphomicrobiales bacterium]